MNDLFGPIWRSQESASDFRLRRTTEPNTSFINYSLIETLNRDVFRDRDLKRFKRCHVASENFDAVLLLNIRVSI